MAKTKPKEKRDKPIKVTSFHELAEALREKTKQQERESANS